MKNPHTIFFRVDANPETGLGHLIRTFSLAQAFKDKRWNCVVIGNIQSPDFKKMILKEKMKLHLLSSKQGSVRDLLETKQIVQRSSSGFSWMVIDGYHFPESYYQSLMRNLVRVVRVDDRGSKEALSCDFILNHNPGMNISAYPQEKDKSKILCGGAFTLLRRDFQNKKFRKINVKENNVLITMGGSDSKKITLRLLQALQKKNILHKRFRIIVGPGNSQKNKIEDIAQKSKLQIEVVESPTNMVPHYDWADLVVTAAGTTAWEVVAAKRALAFFVVAQNQLDIKRVILKNRLGTFLGNGDASSIQKIVRFFEQRKLLRQKSSSSFAFNIDGNGRVVDKIEKCGDLRIRLANLSDSLKLHEWRNDLLTRLNSRTTDKISFKKHQEWYQKRMSLEEPNLWVAEVNSKPCGTLRCDFTYDERELSWTVAPHFRGQEIGKRMLKAFVNRFDAKLVAVINKKNKASQKIAKYAGFQKQKGSEEFQKWIKR